ncbi:MAG: hypothetical protein KatS3mg096_584 [Candidatus Parcubacteria bacterium]|nr:MAG: hypothetical protein KatS3mg096_584 [Candidatus Parcubacteria bacterium]
MAENSKIPVSLIFLGFISTGTFAYFLIRSNRNESEKNALYDLINQKSGSGSTLNESDDIKKNCLSNEIKTKLFKNAVVKIRVIYNDNKSTFSIFTDGEFSELMSIFKSAVKTIQDWKCFNTIYTLSFKEDFMINMKNLLNDEEYSQLSEYINKLK